MENSILCPHCGKRHSSDTTHCPIKGLPIYKRNNKKNSAKETIETKYWVIGGIIAGILLAGFCLITVFWIFPALSNQQTQVVTPPYTVPTLTLPAFETRVAMNTQDPTIQTATSVVESPPQTSPTQSTYQVCDDSRLISQLRIGDTAQVALDPPLPNRVRQEPNTTATVIGYIDPGQSVTIIDGPACSEGWVWWKVETLTDGLNGWTAEGDQESFWLVPVP